MTSPIHQVQVSPGELVIPSDRLPAGLVLVRWDITIPTRQGSPDARAIVTAREDLGDMGFLKSGQWQLIPSYPIEGNDAMLLSKIQRAYGAELLIQSEGYQVGILSFFRHPRTNRLNSIQGQNMGIQSGITPTITSNNSTNTSVAASSSAAVTVAANADRLGGLIVNKSNRILYVKFGDPTQAPLLTAGGDFSEVPSSGNIDIPDNYTGIIGLIWAAGFATGGKAIVTQLIPQ